MSDRVSDRARLCLEHMLESIRLVGLYLEGVDKAVFLTSPQLQDSICRRLEIIGEAAARLPAGFTAQHDHVPWAKIRGMRNILIHEYFQVDLDAVWTTATRSLPELERQLRQLA